MKKILYIFIACLCLVSCGKSKETKETFYGRIVLIRENYFFNNEIVIKTDKGKIFSVLSKNETVDWYLYNNKIRVKISVSTDNECNYYTNNGIEPIR